MARAASYDVAHLIEWVFVYYEHHNPRRLCGAKNLDAFREMMFAQCPELRTVYDLALANKHRFLTVAPERRTIRGATDAYVVAEDRVKLSDGRDYGEILEGAVNFWRDFLGK